MQEASGAMAYAEALRGYVSQIREHQGASQRELAEAMGISRGTYIAWETGETKDLKVPLLIRALRFLGVPLEHLEVLEGAETEDDGRMFANDWLNKLTPEQRESTTRIQDKFRQVIELGDRDPELLRQVVERLKKDAENDPGVLEAIIVYLDGRRSGRNSR